MAPLDMNFSTAVVLLILAVLVVLAVRRMIGRGLCDSGGSCEVARLRLTFGPDRSRKVLGRSRKALGRSRKSL